MTLPLYVQDERRWVDRRCQYLAARYNVRSKLARTLAWSELGYSSSGIAKRIDSSESAVRGYLDELADRFGPPAAWAKPTSKLAVDAPLTSNEA